MFFSAVFMFTPRMVEDECNQPEQLQPLTFFLIFFKYHYHRLLSHNAACEVKGGTLVEWSFSML